VAKEGITDEEIDKTIKHFDDYLSSRQLQLIRRSLSIRKAWESEETYTTQDEMYKWKRDLNKEFDYGSTVLNLCSSEYYDESGLMRDIIEDIAVDADGKTEIQEIYRQVLKETPFVVYVGKYGGKTGE